MTSGEFFLWLQNSPVAHAVSKSSHLVGAGLQVAHIFGLFLLLASILLVSLRLMGWLLPDQPVTLLSRLVTRYIWIGLALAAISGTLMFITMPLRYSTNRPFVLKMGFLFVAVLLQWFLFRRVAARDFPEPAVARTTVVLTVTVWLAVAWAGRFIGFV